MNWKSKDPMRDEDQNRDGMEFSPFRTRAPDDPAIGQRALRDFVEGRR
jgi:hypothetical protein